MSAIQYIERNGKRLFAVVPIDVFNRMAGADEDVQDIAAVRDFESRDDGFRVPHEVMKRELETGSSVLAWRQYRQMSQEALAKACGISKPYLSQIETGKRAGSTRTLRKLAKALGVSLDAVAPSGSEMIS